MAEISKPRHDFGYDHSTNAVEIKEPPHELVALRTELSKEHNKSIYDYLAHHGGNSLPEILGTLGAILGVAMHGEYEVPEVCSVLLSALRKRNNGASIKLPGRNSFNAEPFLRTGTRSFTGANSDVRISDPFEREKDAEREDEHRWRDKRGDAS